MKKTNQIITLACLIAVIIIGCKKEKNNQPVPSPPIVPVTPPPVVADTTVTLNVILYKDNLSSAYWYNTTLSVKSNLFHSQIGIASQGISNGSYCSQSPVAYSVPMKKGVSDTIEIRNNHPQYSSPVVIFVFDFSKPNPLPVLISNSNFGGVCNVTNRTIYAEAYW